MNKNDYKSIVGIEDLSKRYLGTSTEQAFANLDTPIAEGEVKDIELEISVEQFKAYIRIGNTVTSFISLGSTITLISTILFIQY